MSFAFLTSRTQESFKEYFLNVKNILGGIKLFICDRNKTQTNAIKEIWPSSKIIYCSVHIGRNLRLANNNIYYKFKMMRRKEISEEEFINCCNEYIISNPDTKSSKIIDGIIKETDKWLPSKIIKYTHLDNVTSNRVEGFFGSLKNLIDHKVMTMHEIAKAIFFGAERLRILSASDKTNLCLSNLLSDNDFKKIGVMAINLVTSEYEELKYKGCLPINYGDECCNLHMIYGVPCRHLLMQRI